MDNPSTFLIGVCGGSGSGKTTFVNGIKEAFGESSICFISQDEYYLPKEQQQKDSNGVYNLDLPSCIDSKALYADVQSLLQGKPFERIEYTFNNELATPETIVYKPAKIIIIEGLFILHEPLLRELFDLTLFIDAADPLKIIRRIKRDLHERNYPIDDVVYRYEHHVLPAYNKFLKPYISSCDLVVNNDDSFQTALMVIKGFLKERLHQTSKG